VSARGVFLGGADKLECYRIERIGAGRGSACARVHAASFTAPWVPADFEGFLGAGETIAHGATDGADDQLVAIVVSRRALDEAEILTFAVAPAHRRRGLARRMLSTHLVSLVETGVAGLFLEVDTGNAPARALYASLGFTMVGERTAYYRSAGARPSAALVLRCDLAGKVDPRRA